MGSYKEFLPLMAATGDIEQIHPALHHPGQLLVVFQVQPPFRKVITVHADLYGEPGKAEDNDCCDHSQQWKYPADLPSIGFCVLFFSFHLTSPSLGDLLIS